MIKPISKSKRQLAQLLIEAGVTQFPEGANWAAQDKSGMVWVYENRPKRMCEIWVNNGRGPRKLQTTIPNWHQTVLSRDEFDQIVAETVVQSEPDADGWVEHKGDRCPVGGDVAVCVKFRNGAHNITGISASNFYWKHDNCISDIIAYRLHKPEASESPMTEDERCIQEAFVPESTVTPALDQLLQDWRNADDYAQRKQTEADQAAAMRDERWQAVQARAGEMGVTVGRCDSVAAGDVQSVKIGGEIIATRVVNVERLEGRKGKVLKIDSIAHHGPLLVKFPDDGTYWVKEWQLTHP